MKGIPSIALVLAGAVALLAGCGDSKPPSPSISPTPKAAAVLDADNKTFAPDSTTTYSVTWDAGPSCGPYWILVFLRAGPDESSVQNVVHKNNQSGSGSDAAPMTLTALPPFETYAFIISPEPGSNSYSIKSCPGWRMELYPVRTPTPSPG